MGLSYTTFRPRKGKIMGFSRYLKNTILAVIKNENSNNPKEQELVEKASYIIDGHLKSNKEIITIFAVGIAAANADGIIVKEEKDAIYKMAQHIRPTHPKVAQCVKKMLDNPSSHVEDVLLDAFEFMHEKELVDWEEFKIKLGHLIEDVVKADGVITDAERVFIEQFESYFLVKINIDIDKSL